MVIIDEAHRLKNRNCKLLEELKTLDMEHRVLLTGTPLQNSMEELFSLLNFLEPSTFPSPMSFLQQFGDLKTEEQVEELKAVCAAYEGERGDDGGDVWVMLVMCGGGG